MFTTDAPALALNFLRTAQNYIEPGIYAREYPDFQYRELVPVDNSAPDWTTAIDFFSMGDDVGQAREVAADGDDIPFVDFKLDSGNSRVFMAGIGYRYNLQELAHAQAYGIRLESDRADAARRKYELFVDNVAFMGRPKLGMTGLLNATNVTALAAANGASGTATWTTKTADEILADVNSVLSVIFTASNGIEQANTVLLDQDRYALIATKRLDATMTTTVLEHIQRANIYTQRTGLPLTIRAVFGLETAGAGSTHRLAAYRRSPDVVKIHIPMPLRWLQAEQRLLKFEVPGIFRLGSVEIRRPGAVRYLDGI
ncbi:hypothetical protein CU102_12700 [Phyllobacterium brassicacearum]|uniref:DUF2184 domain-containing protein n=1 Tax=Phyllobacterium brassicacearum TaxID=314235 RepID=A0A2P7BQ81_9HYPH|nr:DUF2184 domain-containing protein [Phyllobacterium brassicacearum]PSH68614.1 hypothetical protein CU102_12700 [Phyllobacterium brassicacearum]TDQ24163.1 hypothetical protein DEV91_11541 [Phyllobacterium brassicacearum]